MHDILLRFSSEVFNEFSFCRDFKNISQVSVTYDLLTIVWLIFRPRFFNLVRDLMLWMDDIQRQMATQDKPRDVSGVELLMNNHQSLKAEIDAREENFAICLNLGRDLLNRKHYRFGEVGLTFSD